MPLFSRLITRGRQGSDDCGRRPVGVMLVARLAGSVVIAGIMAATALPTSLNMKAVDSIELTLQAKHQEDVGPWWQSDVDPRFDLDGPFAIQPAAGPPDEIDMHKCQDILIEGHACRW